VHYKDSFLTLAKKFHTTCLLAVIVTTVSSCSGGGGNGNNNGSGDNPANDPQSSAQTGVFIDSPVAGLNYQTNSISGTTNSAGQFQFFAGQLISFFIGDLVLGATQGRSVITPILLVEGATDANNTAVLNIVRLLMTLDSDANPDNGIQISETAHAAASGVTFDFASDTFEQDVQPFLNSAVAPGTTLVNTTTAQNHFQASLSNNWGTMTWGTDCWNQPCQSLQN